LDQGKETDTVPTVTSYFDPVWNSFSYHTNGSIPWIPKKLMAIGDDFHSQVGDGKVRTTLYVSRVLTTSGLLFSVGKQHDVLKKILWTRPWKAH